MKRGMKKLFYSFLAFLLLISTMPFHTVNAITNPSVDVEAIADQIAEIELNEVPGVEVEATTEPNAEEEANTNPSADDETLSEESKKEEDSAKRNTKEENAVEVDKEVLEEKSNVLDPKADSKTYQKQKKAKIQSASPRMSALDSGEAYIANEFLSIANDDTGRFTVGVTGGNPAIDTDDDQILLYGHPYPGTSFTTVKINGEDHIFTAENVTVDESKNEIISTQTIQNATVKQILTFSVNSTTNRADIVNMRYEIVNNGAEEFTAGTRIMLDTMLGHNDGAPFRVPGIGEVLYERELAGAQVPQYWQAFDNLENPSVIANGTFFRSLYERPDKVQFAYWGDIYDTAWDYEVSEDKPVTRDSAVAIYHNPQSIAPGAMRVIDSYYGIGDFAISDTEPPLSIRITAPQELQEDAENGNYFSNPFTITGYVRNIGEETTKNTKVLLELPEDSGLSILTPQEPSISLGDLAVGEEKIVTWTVLASSQSSDKTIDYSIKVNATDVDEKVVPISLFLPRVTTESNGTISLNKEELHLNVGESETLRATLSGIRGNVTWFSDNPNIASVNSSGKVTAKSGGVATIIAAAGGKIAEAKVIVNGDPIPVESIAFSADKIELNVNQSKRVNVQFTPENATNKRIAYWFSINPFVARVSNGTVTGVSPGTARIYTISEDGRKTASILVEVKDAEPTLDLGDGIDFSETVEGPEISFGGHEFSLFSLPFEMELNIADRVKLVYDSSEDKFTGFFGDLSVTGTNDQNPDGTLTENAKRLRKDAYQNIKSLMSKVGRSTNRDFYNSYRSLIKKNSGFVIKGDQTIFGYVDVVNTRDGYRLAEGQVVVLQTAGFDMRYRFPPAPVAYMKFGVTGSLQTGLKLQLKEAGSLTTGVDVYGSFKGELTPALGVGAGHDAVVRVEAGLEGKLGASLDIPFTRAFNPRDHLGLDFTANVYLEYQALLFINGRNTWKIHEAQLYPRPSSRALSRLHIDNNAGSFKLMPRDYANAPSSFVANNSKRSFSMSQANASRNALKVIKENVYPYGSPVLTTLNNGNQLLVWVDDDRSRTASNRTALYYSIFNGSNWSTPQQVENDGTADFAPSIAVHNNEVYIAWQNSSKIFDDSSVTLDDMAKDVGIRVAKYDGVKFVDFTNISNGSNVPTSVPKIASNGTNLSVIWTENDKNDVLDMSAENRIMESTYSTGSGWTSPGVVVDGLSNISSLDVAYQNGERVLAYAVQDNVYMVKGSGSPIQLTNSGTNRSPIFSSTASGTDLYWYANGGINYIEDLNVSNVKTAVDNWAGIGNFNVMTNNDTRLVYWEQDNGFKTEVYGVYFNEQWGSPVQLINDDSRLRSVNGVMNGNGSATFTFNSVEVDESKFDTKEGPFGKVDLKTTTIMPSSDLAILSNINFDSNRVKPGEALQLSFDVGNVGQKTVEGVKVELSHNGEVVHTENVEGTFLSGEEKYVEVNYTLPANLNDYSVKVKVSPLSDADLNVADNESEVLIGKSNIEVTKPVITGNGATRTLKSEVKNIGYKSATNVEVKLVSDRADGDVVATKVVDRIAPGGSSFVEFEIAIEDMNFNHESNDVVLYVVAEGNEEFKNGLHTNFTKLTNPYDENLLQISEVGIAGNNLIFTIYNNVPEDVEGTILVQTINNGVQDTIGQAAIFQALYGQSLQFDISKLLTNMDESSTIRLFVVDENDVTISNVIDIGGKVDAPVSNPEPGTYKEPQSVVLYTSTTHADIYYTADGTEPTEESTKYTLPINVAETTTIKAIAVKPGQDNSDIVELTFVIEPDEENPGKEDPDKEDPDKNPGDGPGNGGSDKPGSPDNNGKPTAPVGGNPNDDKDSGDKDNKNNDNNKLPTTATSFYNILLIGTVMLGVGIVVIRRVRRRMIS
nr:chitobiase/beta-hexosaminidase C-terminal domain-containing protein [Fredinandcohnia onubensis]